MTLGKSKQCAGRASCDRELTLSRSSFGALRQNWRKETKPHPARFGPAIVAGLAAAVAFASPAPAKAQPSKSWKAAAAAHLRAAPSGGSPAIALVPRNALLTSQAPCAGVWCAVEYNGKRGWVYRQVLVQAALKPAQVPVLPEQPAMEASLNLAPPPAEAPPESSPDEKAGAPYGLIGLSADGFLPMREGPLDSARIVGVLPSSASGIADLKTSVRQWRLVEHNGVKGYVQSRFLARSETAAQRYRIDGSKDLKVFNFGGPDADIVGEIPFYAAGIVPIGECGAEWCHIRYLGLVGYVDMRALRSEAEPEG
jgi:SH3-like domain-containing protein